MEFHHAIVRPPSASFENALTSANLGKPDIQKALQQHSRYIDALSICGLEVLVLNPSDQLPDAPFVEDVAVIFNDTVVFSRPGAESRREEVKLMEPVLNDKFRHIEFIQPPGTMDGGDVLWTNSHFYIGLSNRTNRDGAEQFAAIVRKRGYKAYLVEVPNGLHLKTGLSYLSKNHLLATNPYRSLPLFRQYQVLSVPEGEEYAANVIEINDYVLIPAGFPQTHKLLAGSGYQLLEIPMTEFRKADGGLSCLSLRY